MKKILILSFCIIFILGGCSRQIDYKDPETYVKYTKKQIKEVNSDLLLKTDEYYDLIGLNTEKIVDKYEEILGGKLDSLSDEQAKEFYDKFVKLIDDSEKFSEDQINKAIKKMDKNIEEFNKKTDEQQDRLIQLVEDGKKTAASMYTNKAEDKIDKFLESIKN